MPMVAIFAFVDRELWRGVVVFGDTGGDFGFFARSIADFLGFADPTAFWLVCACVYLAHFNLFDAT